MRMRKDLQSCGVMRVREQICNPRAQLTEMRLRESMKRAGSSLWKPRFVGGKI